MHPNSTAPASILAEAPLASGAIIVKRDRFCAQAMRETVATMQPAGMVSICHTGMEALARLRRGAAVRLGVFGLNLPDIDGLDLIAQVLEERLVEKVLVVSSRCDEQTRLVLRRLRISGYLDCSSDQDVDLKQILGRIENGGGYFSPLHRCPSRAAVPRLSQMLSATESRVLAVIGDGSSDQEAAEWLGMSATTVHTHRQRIMRKLGIHTRAALVRAAVEFGVVRFAGDQIFRPGMEKILGVPGAKAKPKIPAALVQYDHHPVGAGVSSNQSILRAG